eukprot:364899-Chlamydomonas_euryale.AAC.21
MCSWQPCHPRSVQSPRRHSTALDMQTGVVDCALVQSVLAVGGARRGSFWMRAVVASWRPEGFRSDGRGRPKG